MRAGQTHGFHDGDTTQNTNLQLERITTKVRVGKVPGFMINKDRALRF